MLTTSWSVPAGDLEATQEVRAVSPESLDFLGKQSTRPRLGDTGPLGHADLANRLCGKDIAEGNAFSTGWVFNSDNKAPGLYPGLSRILLPLGKFQTLKASGTLPMVFGYYAASFIEQYGHIVGLTDWATRCSAARCNG